MDFEMTNEAQLRELKRENRELKKYLLSVSTVVAQSVAVNEATQKEMGNL
jgi:hypothetical protein